MLSWEKPLVKPMAPGSILHHISFLSTCQFLLPFFLFCNLYFPTYTTKIPKIFTLLSLLDLTFASGREGLTTPLSRWLQGSWLFVQVLGDLSVVSYWIAKLRQDAANATLRSETLRRNCVRCHNHKRWCKKPVKKGAKRLRWRMHQTRFRF